eukprot:TRINITY_DN6835_c0_g4_i1.p4 TRINITY_DN6835_c0_g4~~TRINITY_DN6835_c0_g4_i1.p4  ORF type:complete len:108 (+),score=5.90 TRINITY_DN6835_c0_g4_i1:225-548(+)
MLCTPTYLSRGQLSQRFQKIYIIREFPSQASAQKQQFYQKLLKTISRYTDFQIKPAQLEECTVEPRYNGSIGGGQINPLYKGTPYKELHDTTDFSKKSVIMEKIRCK